MIVEKSVITEFDASALVGLSVFIHNGAEQQVVKDLTPGYETLDDVVWINELHELSIAAALLRCFHPTRLTGREIKSIRKICGWNRIKLVERLGVATSEEEVSAWEVNQVRMEEHGEKLFRLSVWEELNWNTPGIQYPVKQMLRLKIEDPFLEAPDTPIPRMDFHRVLARIDNKFMLVWGADLPV